MDDEEEGGYGAYGGFSFSGYGISTGGNNKVSADGNTACHLKANCSLH